MNRLKAIAILKDWGDRKYAHKAAIITNRDGADYLVYPDNNSKYRLMQFDSFRGSNCTGFYLELVYG